MGTFAKEWAKAHALIASGASPDKVARHLTKIDRKYPQRNPLRQNANERIT